MIWVDWTIIAIILLSSVVGMKRGLVREGLALATWVAAILAARMFAPEVAPLVAEYVKSPMAQLGIAMGGVFLLTLLLGSLVSKVAVMLVNATGLGPTDRLLGIVFGLLRGGAIVTAIVALCGLTPLAENAWWQDSSLIPHFELLKDWSADLLSRLGDNLKTADLSESVLDLGL